MLWFSHNNYCNKQGCVEWALTKLKMFFCLFLGAKKGFCAVIKSQTAKQQNNCKRHLKWALATNQGSH
jgi:hypothetical protein